MDILLHNAQPRQEQVLLKNDWDTNEWVVRNALVKVWTRLLEEYARPGANIPSVEAVRKKLLDRGVDAAVDAVVSEHWFVFSFMVREMIEEKVKKELSRFDLAEFVEDVRHAQHDPALLNRLRARIKEYVLEVH